MKILIIYATLTGMTGEIATTLQERLAKELPDHQFNLANVSSLPLEGLTRYEKAIFGASTWDDGIPPPDGEAFLEKLIRTKPDLSTVEFALFGLGDSIYPAFCAALPLIRQDLEACRAKVSTQDFTMDGYPDSQKMNELVTWAKTFIG